MALHVAAQDKVKLSGRVIDDEQNPVLFAVVKVDGQAAGTTTDLQGRYQLEFSTADTVTVSFSMIGYVTKKKTLVRPKGSLRLNITLQTQSIDMGEVTVKEVRRQMNSTQHLNAENLKRLPSTTGNAVEELVATQAGVSTHNELSSQYNVRGGSFDENSVYINGVEVYRPMLISSGQQEGLSVINSDMVESINFSAGGFDAKYGDKMSSVLDITYKKPKKFEASVSASLLGAGLYVGYAKRNFSMTHGVRYKTNQYMLGSLETKGEYSPRFLDYQTYISWSPNKRWSLDFIGNISQNQYDFLPTNRQTNFGTMQDVKSFRVYFDGKEEDLFRTLFGTLSLSHSFTDRTKLSLLASAFTTKERETYDIQGQYWLDETNTTEQLGVGTYMEHARNYLDANMKSLKVLFSHKPKGHDIQTGLTWKHEIIEENSREWEMRDSAGYSMPQTSEGPVLFYTLRSRNETDSKRYGFYLQDTYRFRSTAGLFTLTAGIRGSYWDWNKEFIFSPRASLALIPAFNEKFTLRVAAGVYYQAPFYKEFRDTTQVDGIATVSLNRDIRSQRSLHFVAGGDYNFRAMDRPFRFSMEVYYKALSNLIPYNIDNVRISYYGRNLSKGYATGIDMKLFGEFVPGTDSWLSFSLMKTEEKINGQWLPRPTDQRYRLSLYFTDYFPGSRKWKMNLKGTLAGGLPFGPPHSGREAAVFRTSPYRRVDIGMSRCIIDRSERENQRGIRSLWLGVDIFNLLNISNVNSYYWVTDTRNNQFAVPNYLTSRQINVRLLLDF